MIVTTDYSKLLPIFFQVVYSMNELINYILNTSQCLKIVIVSDIKLVLG